MNRRFLNFCLGRLPGLTVSFACFVIVIRAAHFTWMYSGTTPFWDFWNWISDYKVYSAGHYGFHDLIKPHNEHRIATTRILLFVDAKWFHMTGHFVILINFVLLALLGAVLNILMCSPAIVAARVTLPVMLSVALMTSTCQWQNLILPFQIGYALMCLFIVGAAALTVKATEPQPDNKALIYATLAGLCFLSACFSMAGGLLELPWLILLLVLRRANLSSAVVIAGIAAAAASAFLYDYHPLTNIPLVDATSPGRLIAIAEFAAGFLGSAFYAFDTMPFVVGFTSLFLFSVSAIMIFRSALLRQTDIPGQTLALFAISGTLVLTAFAAAVSRLSAGMQAALEPRYATQSLVFIACLLAMLAQLYLWVDRPWLTRWIRRSRIVLALAFSGLLACNFSPRYVQDAQGFSSLLASQAESMRQNVLVPPLFRSIYYGSFAEAKDSIAFIHARKLTVYAPRAEPPPDFVRYLPAYGDLSRLPACSGHVDEAYRLDANRFIFRAWLATSNLSRAADMAELVTSGGVIAARAPATQYRADLPKSLWRPQAPLGFYSGLSASQPGFEGDMTVRIVGRFTKKPRLTCVLVTPLTFGAMRVQTLPLAAKTSPARLAMPPTLQGSYRADFGPSKLHGSMPWPDEITYTSADPDEAATGKITFTVAAPASDDDDVVMPFATEPGVHGQTIETIFQDGYREALVVPSNSLESEWRIVSLPHETLRQHGGGTFRIVATDAGTGWGEWLAVGQPMLTKLDPEASRMH